ncbi:MAG: PCRF domain-containing protein, partial [Amphibacillus sp.]|nr:PCRF domain-containing protein [Amphibacillus sp.]
MESMLDKLAGLEERYEKLNELLSDPDVISDTNKLREYSKEQSDLQDIVDAYREYK